MSAIVVKGRTWLCPECDGYGAFGNGRSPNDPSYEDSECADCEGRGVIHASYSQAWAMGLHPWSGDRGRSASRDRFPHKDPLLRLAEVRAIRRTPDGGIGARFGYDYPHALAVAMCRSRRPIDRWALADRYDVRVRALMRAPW